MRVLEGAGIAGLKWIPRKTADGIERPMLEKLYGKSVKKRIFALGERFR